MYDQDDNLRKMFRFISSLSGQGGVLTVHKTFIDIFGDISTALMFSQILYWSDKGRNGWFYKSYKDWDAEIGIKERNARRIVTELRERGLIETQVHKVGDTPKLHYRVIMEKVIELILSWNGYAESEVSDSDEMKESEPAKFTGTLNTEITLQENTINARPIGENAGLDEFLSKIDELNPPTETAKTPLGMLVESRLRGEPLTAEDYKARIVGALARFDERRLTGSKIPSIEEFLLTVPDYLRSFAEVFCYYLKRPPRKKEKAYWIQGWQDQHEIGLSVDNIREAIREMTDSGMTIKSPESVTAIAQKYKLSGDNKFKGSTEVWTSDGRIV